MDIYGLVAGSDNPDFKMYRDFEIANKTSGKVVVYKTSAFGEVIEWDNDASTGKLINTDKINDR